MSDSELSDITRDFGLDQTVQPEVKMSQPRAVISASPAEGGFRHIARPVKSRDSRLYTLVSIGNTFFGVWKLTIRMRCSWLRAVLFFRIHILLILD
jgi:hypothetical protein